MKIKYVFFVILVIALSLMALKIFNNFPIENNETILTKEVSEDLERFRNALLEGYKITNKSDSSKLSNNSKSLKGCLEGVHLPNTSTCIPHIVNLAEQFAQMTTQYTIAKRTEKPAWFFDDSINLQRFEETEDINVSCDKSSKGLCGFFNALMKNLVIVKRTFEDKNETKKELAKFSSYESDLSKLQYQNLMVSISPWLETDEKSSFFDRIALKNEEIIASFVDKNTSCKLNFQNKNLYDQLKVFCSNQDTNSTQCKCLSNGIKALEIHTEQSYRDFFYLEFEKAYKLSQTVIKDENGRSKPPKIISLMQDIRGLKPTTQEWLGIDMEVYNQKDKLIREYLEDNKSQDYKDFVDIQSFEENSSCLSLDSLLNKQKKEIEACNKYMRKQISYAGKKIRQQEKLTRLFSQRYKAAERTLDKSLKILGQKMGEGFIDEYSLLDDVTGKWVSTALYFSYVGEAAKKMYAVTDSVTLCDTHMNGNRECQIPMRFNSPEMGMDILTYPIEQINHDSGQYKFSKPIVKVNFDANSTQVTLKKKTGVSFAIKQLIKQLETNKWLKNTNTQFEKEQLPVTQSFRAFDFGQKMLLDSNVTVHFMDKNASRFFAKIYELENNESVEEEKYYKNNKEDTDVYLSKANPGVNISAVNIAFSDDLQWYGQVKTKQVEDFLDTLSLPSGIRVNSSHLSIENNDMVLITNLLVEQYFDAPSVDVKLNLTSGNQKSWAKALKIACDEALVTFLKDVNKKIPSNEKVKRWLNIPEKMHVVGVTIASKEPLRFNALAYPDDKPSLLTSFSLKEKHSDYMSGTNTEWGDGILVLPAATAMAIKQESIKGLPSIQSLIDDVFEANYTSAETIACLSKIEAVYKKVLDGKMSVETLLREVRKTAIIEEKASGSIMNLIETMTEEDRVKQAVNSLSEIGVDCDYSNDGRCKFIIDELLKLNKLIEKNKASVQHAQQLLLKNPRVKVAVHGLVENQSRECKDSNKSSCSKWNVLEDKGSDVFNGFSENSQEFRKKLKKGLARFEKTVKVEDIVINKSVGTFESSYDYIADISPVIEGMVRLPEEYSDSVSILKKDIKHSIKKIQQVTEDLQDLKKNIEESSKQAIEDALKDSNITDYKEQFKERCEEADFHDLGINCESPGSFFKGIVKSEDPIGFFRQKVSEIIAETSQGKIDELRKNDYKKMCMEQFKSFDNPGMFNFDKVESDVLNKSRDKACETFDEGIAAILDGNNVEEAAKKLPKKILQIYGKTLRASLEGELAKHLWENDMVYAYNETLNQFNELKVSFKQKQVGVCVGEAPYNAKPVLSKQDCESHETFYNSFEAFKKDIIRTQEKATKTALLQQSEMIKSQLREICVETASRVGLSDEYSNETCQTIKELTEDPKKVIDTMEGALEKIAKDYVKGVKSNLKEALTNETDTLSQALDSEISDICKNLNKLAQQNIDLLGGELNITLPEKCPSSDMGFGFELTELPLGKYESIKIKNGIKINTERLKSIDFTSSKSKEALPAVLDIQWDKVEFEPKLETIIKDEFAFGGDYFSLNEIRPINDGIKIAATLHSPTYPLSIPTNLKVDRRGFHIKMGNIDETVLENVCSEIDMYFRTEKIDIFDGGARILSTRPAYCKAHKLKGLKFEVETKFPKPVGEQSFQAILDIDTGLHFEMFDVEKMLASAALRALNIQTLEPAYPYYNYDDGLTLFFDGEIKTPLDVDLGFGFKVSPKKFAFRGPVEISIPYWIDTPSGLSVGKGGIGFNPEKEEVSLRGSVTLISGEATSRLFRVDGVATMGVKDATIVQQGSVKLLSFIELMNSTTTISSKHKLFKTEISTTPLLKNGVDISGLLRVQEKTPNPFVVAKGEGNLFGADIAVMDLQLNRDFSGRLNSKLKFPLYPRGLEFEVKAKKHLRDLSTSMREEIGLGPFKFALDAAVNEQVVSGGVSLEPLGQSVSFSVPSLRSLDPAFLLGLVKDFGLDLGVPKKLSMSSSSDDSEVDDGKKPIPDKTITTKRVEEKAEDKSTPKKIQGILGLVKTTRIQEDQICEKKKIAGIKYDEDCHINRYPVILDQYKSLAGKSSLNAGHMSSNNYHHSQDNGYEYLIQNPWSSASTIYVFPKGAKTWRGRYSQAIKADSIVTHKYKQGESTLLIRRGSDNKIFIVPEGSDYQNEAGDNRIDGGENYTESEFGKTLLGDIAWERYKNNKTVNVVDGFVGNSSEWALLETYPKNQQHIKTYTLVHYKEDRDPNLVAFEVIGAERNMALDSMIVALNANIKNLGQLFENTCQNKKGVDITNTCGYLMVDGNDKLVFGLENKESNETSYNAYWLKDGQYSDKGRLEIRDDAAEKNSFDLSRLPKLQGNALTDLLSSAIDGAQRSGLDIETATFNYGTEKKRIAFYGKHDNNPLLAVVAEDVKNKNGKNFEYRSVEFNTMKKYFNRGVTYMPSDKSVNKSNLSEEEIWLYGITWPVQFYELGFRSDPVNGFYIPKNRVQ